VYFFEFRSTIVDNYPDTVTTLISASHGRDKEAFCRTTPSSAATLPPMFSCAPHSWNQNSGGRCQVAVGSRFEASSLWPSRASALVAPARARLIGSVGAVDHPQGKRKSAASNSTDPPQRCWIDPSQAATSLRDPRWLMPIRRENSFSIPRIVFLVVLRTFRRPDADAL
jgi:hypothetical protein